MSQIFTIQDDKIIIKTLSVEKVQGDVSVEGTLTVNSLKVLDQDQPPIDIVFENINWTVESETELFSKGLHWTWPTGSVQLAYRSGARLWTDADIDLAANKSYRIDNIPVIDKESLGGSITRSNLKELGSLRKLTVTGDATVGDFAHFNSSFGRLGLNTDNPNGVLSVVDNNVEVIVSSPRDNLAQIGTYTNHDLELVTDNLPRIAIKSNGQVVFGNESTKNADVRIYGTLTVDTVVADNRIDRYQPLEFKTSRDRAIYGQGLIWTGTGNMRQFIMMAGPDRLWSTESIDLAEDQSYMINGVSLLSSKGLGSSVTQSNISKLGTLEELNVEGEATFFERINATRSVINAKNILFNDGNEFTITNSRLASNQKIVLEVLGQETFYADRNEIAIGDKQDNRKPVKVFGQMTVGINTPPEGVDFAVSGNIQFANKKFVTGTSAPNSGSFSKGDICWNSNPTVDNYIGWVCIDGGAPGQWLPFGTISRQ
jgi:hypothetical protein